ncbi:hypothetical protein D9M70_543720 [compost metagenome]
MAEQIVHVGGTTMCPEIVRRRANDIALRGNRPGNQVAVGLLAHADHQVKALYDRVDDALGQLQFHRQARILGVEAAQVGHHVAACERGQASDAQASGDALLQRRHSIAGFAQVLEDAGGALI